MDPGSSEPFWGIDLGGTKIEGCVVSRSRDGLDVLARLRLPTESHRGYREIVSRVADLVGRLESETGLERPCRIGVGAPGARRPDGKMKNCNTTCLNGQDLQSDLEAALGTSVSVANDADCFALAESQFGAGKGFSTVFGVIMGTGVGGGFVVDGHLVTGPNGLTGEWGHTTLEPDGEPCYCGRKGCVERYLAGPAVEAAHATSTGRRLSLAEIAGSVAISPECELTVRHMCAHFGRALATVVNVLDPSAIILGGGAGQVPQLRTWGRDALGEHVFGSDFVTPLLNPELGDSAGVFGAALLTFQSF